MSSLTPAQRRVLEAARRGEVLWLALPHGSHQHACQENGGGCAYACGNDSSWDWGLFQVDASKPKCPSCIRELEAFLASTGRAELGITETEED